MKWKAAEGSDEGEVEWRVVRQPPLLRHLNPRVVLAREWQLFDGRFFLRLGRREGVDSASSDKAGVYVRLLRYTDIPALKAFLEKYAKVLGLDARQLRKLRDRDIRVGVPVAFVFANEVVLGRESGEHIIGLPSFSARLIFPKGEKLYQQAGDVEMEVECVFRGVLETEVEAEEEEVQGGDSGDSGEESRQGRKRKGWIEWDL